METGTLKELNVQPGDVVEAADAKFKFEVHNVYDALVFGTTTWSDGVKIPKDAWRKDGLAFRIISRASDTPKTWGEMTDAERAEIALAFVDGRPIDAHDSEDWWECPEPSWSKSVAYRVRPEPVRETVTITGFSDSDVDWIFAPLASEDYDTHRITFDTLDGEPVTDSIRMEKL